MEKLEDELSHMKATIRRIMLVATTVAIMLGLRWALTGTPTQAAAVAAPRIIRANEFIVEDAKGIPRIALGTVGDLARLCILKDGKEPIAILMGDNRAASLLLAQPDGNASVLVQANKTVAGASFHAADGKTWVDVSAKESRSAISINDSKERPRVFLGLDKRGASLVLWDEAGTTWSAP